MAIFLQKYNFFFFSMDLVHNSAPVRREAEGNRHKVEAVLKKPQEVCFFFFGKKTFMDEAPGDNRPPSVTGQLKERERAEIQMM